MFRLYLTETNRFLLAVTIMAALSAGLLGFRVWYTQENNYVFLLWNLFLAFIPWLLLHVARRWMLFERQMPAFLLTVTGVLFLPNAPYLVTDLFHIRYQGAIPLWFDTLLIFSFAVNGLFLFYKAMRKLEAILNIWLPDWYRRLAMAGVFFLSGFGIYLGRYLRFNSWDLLADPASLITSIAGIVLHPQENLQAFGVSFFYGMALLVMYLVTRLLMASRRSGSYVLRW
jgi:uncharacterized membrane protein